MHILGVRVDEFDKSGFLSRIESDIEDCLSGKGKPFQIITINAEGIYYARDDAKFREVIEQAAYVTPDGSGVLWAADKLGNPLPERVSGIDLIYDLCAMAVKHDYGVYLLGACEGVSTLAAGRLVELYPGLRIVGTDNGYFRDREEQVIEKIAAAAPQLLFVGMGMPYQEEWISLCLDRLGACCVMGVGGSFDVISGNLRRAPRLWQKLRLEWLYRLIQQPSRWRRFLNLPRFMREVKKEIRMKANS